MRVKLLAGGAYSFGEAMQWDTEFNASKFPKYNDTDIEIEGKQLREAGGEFFRGDDTYVFAAGEYEVTDEV